MDRKRGFIQAAASLLSNAHLSGFVTGKIYQGRLKSVCLPGLNCYSCPGAVASCPIGSLQNSLSGQRFRFPAYVLGVLIFCGALLGRGVCGFLCPFGWLQELLHRIPFFAKKHRIPGDRALRWVKYAVLVLAVVILPLMLTLTPFFCKYICPAGTLAGTLLALRDSMLRAQLGGLYLWKAGILTAVILSCLLLWRPFCKYLCPLGALYALFNRVSLLRMHLDEAACVRCGKCTENCRMGVDPSRTPNSTECIRCGDCVRACPEGALRLGFTSHDTEKAPERAK